MSDVFEKNQVSGFCRDAIYTTGDFLCNTFPSFIFKKRNPQTVWVANIFHINLPPIRRKQNKFLYALFSFLFQRVSLLLIRKADLVLIGDGEESVVKNLKYEFLKAGVLESIKFSGFIEKDEDVYRILKTGKVFILPSYEEGWSIAVFEAIACGLLPIVYDLPVFNEIFGKKINTIPVGNIFVFAETIVSFLKNDELRKKYVTNLSKEIKKYDWSIVAKKEENEIFKINFMKKLIP
jgi:glycosyltransferase involved in cell wall biosynthesis